MLYILFEMKCNTQWPDVLDPQDLHWKTPYDHSFKQYILKASEM